jgi:hypothetical protein
MYLFFSLLAILGGRSMQGFPGSPRARGRLEHMEAKQGFQGFQGFGHAPAAVSHPVRI